jgi:hypothetical protein
MLSAGETYYNSYAADVRKDNVEPLLAKEGKWPEDLDGETWHRPEGRDALGHRWGDPAYGPVSVYVSNKGRVMEVQSLRRGMSHLCAVHQNMDDYMNYRRPMSANMYLWG